MTLYDKIKKAIPYSGGVRMLISSIIGIITGAQVFGRVFEVIIYNYSWAHGVRSPIEGIGLLQPLSILFSIALSLFIGTSVLTISFFIQSLSKIIIKPIIIRLEKRFKIEKEKHSKEGVLFSYLMHGVLIAYLAIFSYLVLIRNNPENTLEIKYGSAVFISLIILFGALIYFSISSKYFIVWNSLIIAAITTISSFYFVSDFSKVNYLLQETKFGGGIEVIIERDCRFNSNCSNLYNGHLFLKTNTHYILKNKNSDIIYEIPLNDVMRFQYSTTPFIELPKRLK